MLILGYFPLVDPFMRVRETNHTVGTDPQFLVPQNSLFEECV